MNIYVADRDNIEVTNRYRLKTPQLNSAIHIGVLLFPFGSTEPDTGVRTAGVGPTTWTALSLGPTPVLSTVRMTRWGPTTWGPLPPAFAIVEGPGGAPPGGARFLSNSCTTLYVPTPGTGTNFPSCCLLLISFAWHYIVVTENIRKKESIHTIYVYT